MSHSDGHLDITHYGNGLKHSYSRQIDKALAYIDANYPNLRGKLEAGTYRELKNTAPCPTKLPDVPLTVRISIYR